MPSVLKRNLLLQIFVVHNLLSLLFQFFIAIALLTCVIYICSFNYHILNVKTKSLRQQQIKQYTNIVVINIALKLYVYNCLNEFGIELSYDNGIP